MAWPGGDGESGDGETLGVEFSSEKCSGNPALDDGFLYPESQAEFFLR